MSQPKSTARFWILLLALLMGFLCVQRILFYDFTGPKFVDEIENVTAGVNFFRKGIYSPWAGPFYGYERSVSSGIVITAPPALAWLATGKLFWARVAFGLWNLLFVVLLVGLAARERFGFLRKGWVMGGFALYFLAITFIPYMHALSIHTLGEVIGGCLVGMGFLLAKKYPKTSVALWGVAIWYTKFIYLPYVVAGIGMQVLTDRKIFRPIFWLMLPIAIWNLIIMILVGIHSWWTYLTHETWFAVHVFKGYSSQSGEAVDAPVAHGLIARLHSPELEWAGYDISDKARILFLLFVPLAVLSASLVRRHLRSPTQKTPRNWPLDWLQVALIGTQLLFTFWYFFLHAHMWVRHLVPALLVGLGVLLFYSLEWLASKPVQIRRNVLIAVLAILTLKELNKSRSVIAIERSPEYASRYSVTECAVAHPWTATNSETLTACGLERWVDATTN